MELIWQSPASLQDKEKIEKAFSEAKKLLSIKFINTEKIEKAKNLKNINIAFNKRMRTTAGRADYEKRLISLNLRLLSMNPSELVPTFYHELAHILAFDMFGKKACGHGKYWQCIMRLFKQPIKRCHNMEGAEKLKAKRKAFKVYCGCSSYDVSSVRFNRLLSGEKRYRCISCKGNISANEG
jgi:SprT protein